MFPCGPVSGAWGFGVVVVLCDNVSPLFADASAHEFIPSNLALHVKCSFNVAVVDGVVGEYRGGGR